MNIGQFRAFVLEPTLREISQARPSLEPTEQRAGQLIMGTIAQESGFQYLHQINGPACGLIQLEPTTFFDILDNFRPASDLLVDLGYSPHLAEYPADANVLHWDLRLNVIMCRLYYMRAAEQLPEYDDIQGMARYWKVYYNTALGRGTENEFMENYGRLLL